MRASAWLDIECESTETRTNGRGLGRSCDPRNGNSHAPYSNHLAVGAHWGRCDSLAQQQSFDTVAQDGHSQSTAAIHVAALDRGHASSTGSLRAKGLQKLWTKEESECYSGLAEHDSAKGDHVSHPRETTGNEWALASMILNCSTVMALAEGDCRIKEWSIWWK